MPGSIAWGGWMIMIRGALVLPVFVEPKIEDRILSIWDVKCLVANLNFPKYSKFISILAFSVCYF